METVAWAWAALFTVWSCLEMARGGRGDAIGGQLGLVSQIGWIGGIFLTGSYPLLITSAFFSYMYFKKIVDTPTAAQQKSIAALVDHCEELERKLRAAEKRADIMSGKTLVSAWNPKKGGAA